jgi:adenylosuccinate synthase
VLKAFTSRVGEGPFPTELHDKFGDYLREVGHEYGTTTGRPRRIGWLDLVMARYAQRINGVTDFALTKLDNYDGLDEIPVCVAYEVNGVRHDEMPVSQTDFHHAMPIYETLPGWKQDISGCRSFDDLPKDAQRFVEFVESRIGARISIVGVGPGREAVIERHSVLSAA